MGYRVDWMMSAAAAAAVKPVTCWKLVAAVTAMSVRVALQRVRVTVVGGGSEEGGAGEGGAEEGGAGEGEAEAEGVGGEGEEEPEIGELELHEPMITCCGKTSLVSIMYK